MATAGAGVCHIFMIVRKEKIGASMEPAQPKKTMPSQVTITQPGHRYHGQVGQVEMVYYDYKHTGDSPDLYYLVMPDGKAIRVLSTGVEAIIGASP
jgi:hypothetical protein